MRGALGGELRPKSAFIHPRLLLVNAYLDASSKHHFMLVTPVGERELDYPIVDNSTIGELLSYHGETQFFLILTCSTQPRKMCWRACHYPDAVNVIIEGTPLLARPLVTW